MAGERAPRPPLARAAASGSPWHLQEATELPDYGKIAFPDLSPVPLGKVLPNASDEAVDLVTRLLRYRPGDRLSAEEVRLARSTRPHTSAP